METFSADSVLETTFTDKISRKVESFTAIIYAVGRETFGTEEIKVKQQGVPTMNRLEIPIPNVRRDLKSVEKNSGRRVRSIKKKG